jgi:hypothetical protein
MSSNTNNLFWVITGAVIIVGIFLLVSFSNNDTINQIFDKFSDYFDNSSSGNSVLERYYSHEPNYENLVITDESDFVFNEETKEITAYKGNGREIVIPYEINGIPVEKISNIGLYIYEVQGMTCNMERDMYSWEYGNMDGWYDYAIQRGFMVNEGGDCIHLQTLTKAVIPNSVKVIGNYAFYFQQLTNINIPDSVVEIGEQAFRDNQFEGEYVVSRNVERIDIDAFMNNKLTKVDFGQAMNLTYIGPEAFMMNNISNKIIIPENVDEIGVSTFIYNKIPEVDLSLATKLSVIDYNCFYGNLLTKIEIPSNITEIRNYAFSDNQLNEVKMLGSSTNIWTDVFHNNNTLNTIKVPNSALNYYRSQSSLSRYTIVGGGY